MPRLENAEGLECKGCTNHLATVVPLRVKQKRGVTRDYEDILLRCIMVRCWRFPIFNRRWDGSDYHGDWNWLLLSWECALHSRGLDLIPSFFLLVCKACLRSILVSVFVLVRNALHGMSLWRTLFVRHLREA